MARGGCARRQGGGALRRASLPLALLLAALLAAGPALAVAHVYHAKHRPAEELLPLAEAALAGRGSAVVDRGTNSLVLLADESALAETVALLEAQDRRPRTVVLRFETQRSADLDAAGIRVDWSVDTGSVRIGNVRFPAGRSGASVRPEAERLREVSSFSGHLRVLDGETGRIITGESFPVRVRQGWHESTTFVSAESGFEARPRIQGDGRVRVELFPFESRPGPGGSVEFSEAPTTLSLAPGETVALGGVGRAASASGVDAFTGAAAGSTREERLLLLRVDVE